MLDSRASESEIKSWVYVAIGTAVIYATIPVARALRDSVETHIGREIFLLVTLGIAIAIGWAAFANLRRRQLPPSAFAWMFTVLVLFAACIYYLRNIPEEALHLAEYGILGLLVYRALTHRIRDVAIYPTAAIVVGIIGLLDEYLQWIVPSRVYDLRDVGINLFAGALAQVAIAGGLRPRIIAARPSRKSLASLCFTLALLVALLTLGSQNTPPRVARYASQVDALAFLLRGRNVMTEYGYRHEDAGIGVFYSRFSLAELQRLNRERGIEVAAILDHYIRGEGYGHFLNKHTAILDPYAHEAGVRLFRREYHLDRARENNPRIPWHYLIASRENQLLEKYFPGAIGHSKHKWDQVTELEASRGAETSPSYESKVSANIITRVTAGQVLWAGTGVTLALIVIGWRLRYSSRDDL